MLSPRFAKEINTCWNKKPEKNWIKNQRTNRNTTEHKENDLNKNTNLHVTKPNWTKNGHYLQRIFYWRPFFRVPFWTLQITKTQLGCSEQFNFCHATWSGLLQHRKTEDNTPTEPCGSHSQRALERCLGFEATEYVIWEPQSRSQSHTTVTQSPD